MDKLGQLVDVYKKDGTGFENIINRFKPVIAYYYTKYYVNDFDKDDFFQVCYIALVNACSVYSKEKAIMTFFNFGCLCIKRQLYSEIRRSLSGKRFKEHEKSDYLDEIYLKKISLKSKDFFQLNPEEVLEMQEIKKCVSNAIENTLTQTERNIISKYIDCKSLRELSETHNIEYKKADNSIQRAKKKLRTELKSYMEL